MKIRLLETYGLSLVQTVAQAFLVIFLAAYVYWKWKFLYWEKLGVLSPNPKFPLGSISLFPKKFLGIHLKEIYTKLKTAGQKHGGIYQFFMPVYLVLDPKLIRHILQQDFENFTERGFYYNEKDDPLTANLITLGGKRWQTLRTKLSPAFTSAKIKTTLHLLVQCANQMKNSIDVCCLRKQPVDTKQAMACYTTDVIGSCAFGLDCSSFQNPNSPFRQHGDRAFSFVSKFRIFKGVMGVCWPDLARRLRLTIIEKESSDFFINVVNHTVQYRKSNNIIRKDILQQLMELYSDCDYKNAHEKKKANMELAANVAFFFFAGFETSSTTLTYCLYELAYNHHIQDKLREEIITVLSEHGEEITYEAITEMKYLHKVIEVGGLNKMLYSTRGKLNHSVVCLSTIAFVSCIKSTNGIRPVIFFHYLETLRKHPPITFVSRISEQEYHVPGTDLTLEKGMRVCVPIIGLHHDPEYFPGPEVFDPERFSEENKRNRVPFTYMPFGEGPRICIGLRFALMKIKVVLITLVKNYRLSLNEKTDVPLKYEESALVLTPKSQVLLNVETICD